MNTSTAEIMVREWLGARNPALASQLAGLAPGPEPDDAWAPIDGQLWTLTRRSVFRVSAAGHSGGDVQLSVINAAVKDDGTTVITVQDELTDHKGQWTRRWHIANEPPDVLSLDFETEPFVGGPYPRPELFARQLASLAGSTVGDPVPPPRPR